MKKSMILLIFLFSFFLLSDDVMADKTSNCIASLSPVGSNRRAYGHQSQWFSNGSYTVKGSVSSNCVTVSGYNSSIVKLNISGTSFTFSPQKTGQTTATYTASASCTCSGSEIKKSVTFTFSEWGLASLSVNGYSLDPKFYDMTKEYTISVPSNVNTVTLNFSPNEKSAKLKVNGISVSSGDNVQAEIINNKITISVTTSVGRTDVTTISVRRDGSLPASSEEKSIQSTSSKSSSSSKKSYNSTTSSSSSFDENPDAGSAEMFIVWFLGIAAVGYSVYYFKAIKNTN